MKYFFLSAKELFTKTILETMDKNSLLEIISENWQMGLITKKDYYCQKAEILEKWYRKVIIYIPSLIFNLYNPS